MLDRDFLPDGGLPLPNSSTDSPQDFRSSAAFAAIREKAEAIVREAISTKQSPADRLSLMEELAQDIVELCSACGDGPGCGHCTTPMT